MKPGSMRISFRPLFLGLMVLVLTGIASGVRAAAGVPYDVQRIDTTELGIRHPLGVAYSPSEPAFLVASPAGVVKTNVYWDAVDRHAGRAGCLDYASFVYLNPFNTVFALDCSAGQLIPVERSPVGLNTGRLRFYRPFDLSIMDLEDPRGVAFDPNHNALYILDASGPALFRLEADRRNSFAATAALLEGRLTVYPLEFPVSADLRGLAFHPFDSKLFSLDSSNAILHTWSTQGVSTGPVDISGVFFRDPQALVFAPSSDSTDLVTNYNLFIADSGSGIDAVLPGQIIEVNLGD